MTKLIELVNKLQKDADLLKVSYPNAFAHPMGASPMMMPPRFAWEVRIGSAHKALETAIEKLKSACAEADDLQGDA